MSNRWQRGTVQGASRQISVLSRTLVGVGVGVDVAASGLLHLLSLIMVKGRTMVGFEKESDKKSNCLIPILEVKYVTAMTQHDKVRYEFLQCLR